MTIPVEQAEVAAWLRKLAGADPVETHISALFIGEHSVIKLRKAARLSFVDFTSLAAREHAARREFELNAPAAPGLYHDVVAIIRRRDGSFGFAETAEPAAGETVDWVVRMALVPKGDFLDVMAAQTTLEPALLDALADKVAAYHAALPPAHTGRDAAAALRGIIVGNVASALAAGLPQDRVREWEAAALACHARLTPWLRARNQQGFVRRAHGDLHLGNVCIWRGGPVPFDALEFDEELATIDIAYDLAFLLMDLDHRAGRDAANRVMNRIVARSGDADLVTGLALFLSLRAMVRAHVEASRGHRDSATAYLARATGYLAPPPPPVLVAVGGLPGSGKSTLARALAPHTGAAPGALILRSDEIRKRRHAAAPEQRLPPAAYGEAESRAVMEELAATARAAIARGHSVIADATFMDPADREAIHAAAAAAGFVGLWLTAPLAVLEARVTARAAGGADASDADLAVLRRAAASLRDRAADWAADWATIDATEAATALVAARSRLATATC